jgi:hypothetical protein
MLRIGGLGPGAGAKGPHPSRVSPLTAGIAERATATVTGNIKPATRSLLACSPVTLRRGQRGRPVLPVWGHLELSLKVVVVTVLPPQPLWSPDWHQAATN